MKKIQSIVLGFALVVSGVAVLGSSAGAQSLPSGCSSTAGYSTTTGASCNNAVSIQSGCSSTAGFNTGTGAPCNGSTVSSNGGMPLPAGCASAAGISSVNSYSCNGATGLGVNSGIYYNLQGCNSTSGYSSVNGLPCNNISSVSIINGVAYIPGCTSYAGFSSTTGLLCLLSAGVPNGSGAGIPTTPSLPNTGLGKNAPFMTFMLLASLGLLAYGLKKLSNQA